MQSIFHPDGTKPFTPDCLSPEVRAEFEAREARSAPFANRPATPDEMRQDPEYARLLADGWCLITNEGGRPNPRSPGSPPSYMSDLPSRGFDLVRSDTAYLYTNPACGIRLPGYIAIFCRPTRHVSDDDFRWYAARIQSQGGAPKFSAEVSGQ